MKVKESKLVMLARVISDLDNMRYGIYVSPERVEKEIARIRFSGVRSAWKKCRKEMYEVSRSLAASQKFRKYSVLSVLLRFLAVASLLSVGFLFLLAYIKPEFMSMLGVVRNPIFILIFIMLIPNAAAIADYLVRQHVKDRLRASGIKERRRLKHAIDELISILVREAKKVKVDRKKLKIKLFYVDYNGIEVIKKPGIFRKFYIAIPKF
ncbi:MAG: hypothetical protein ACTSXC_07640 [Candidatus Freyarchaeota archaeon]|nr:MAG: hypothetical protein DRO59_01420 [Candidatus Bathyarchaeota archaeon]